MRLLRVAVVLGAVLAACLATPAQAAQWCVSDPAFVVTTPSGHTVALDLNIYGLGAVNATAVAAGRIVSVTEALSGKYDNVTLVAFTPNGPNGVFQVNYVVTTGPAATGRMLHQVSSHSGLYQQMTFVLPYV
jgi:hypothetical protein